MPDIIFHELHTYHREMWGFLSDDPWDTKFDFLRERGFGNYYNKNTYFFSLITDNSSCFACLFARILELESNRICANYCYLCPITSWRKEVHNEWVTPCVDFMEYRDFVEATDTKRWEKAKKYAEIIMNLEWSIPEGFEI